MLCLARKDHYLICEQGVSITQRHTCTRTHRCPQCDGYPLGAGDQLGQEHQTMPQSAAAAHWEWELREKATQAAATRPKDVTLLFLQTFPAGTFFIWPYSPHSSLPIPLFLPLASFLISASLSRSHFWRPEYICLASATSTSARNKCFALGAEKDGGRRGGREGMAENRAHSVAGWRAESSCCGVDLTDAPR